MVSLLNSRLEQSGFKSCPRISCLLVSLSTQVYNWVLANLIQGIKPCDGLESHPGGSRNTPGGFIYINKHSRYILNVSLISTSLSS